MTYVTKVERLPLEGIASVRPQRAATALRDHVLPMGGAEGKFPLGWRSCSSLLIRPPPCTLRLVCASTLAGRNEFSMNSEDEAQNWASIRPFPDSKLPKFSVLGRSGRKIGNASWFTQLRPGLIGLGPPARNVRIVAEGILSPLGGRSMHDPANIFRECACYDAPDVHQRPISALLCSHGRQPLGIIVKCG
jgi:hypothetical protein